MMDALKQQMIEVLKKVDSALWDGVKDKGEEYLPYTYICHAVRDEAMILARNGGHCHFQACNMIDSLVRRNLDYVDAVTVGSACHSCGIESDERIQAARKKFVKAILHELETSDMTYPDNSILESILQEFQ